MCYKKMYEKAWMVNKSNTLSPVNPNMLAPTENNKYLDKKNYVT